LQPWKPMIVNVIYVLKGILAPVLNASITITLNLITKVSYITSSYSACIT